MKIFCDRLKLNIERYSLMIALVRLKTGMQTYMILVSFTAENKSSQRDTRYEIRATRYEIRDTGDEIGIEIPDREGEIRDSGELETRITSELFCKE
jgi:hypothetical protein